MIKDMDFKINVNVLYCRKSAVIWHIARNIISWLEKLNINLMMKDYFGNYYKVELTPWSRGLLEKLTVSQLVKKFPLEGRGDRGVEKTT
jgi:hypothetical protein